MRRIIALILIFSMIFVLCSCGNAIKRTEDAIDNIGTVTLSDECSKRIEKARKLYDGLSDAQKKEVRNYSDLRLAESTFNEQFANDFANWFNSQNK